MPQQLSGMIVIKPPLNSAGTDQDIGIAEDNQKLAIFLLRALFYIIKRITKFTKHFKVQITPLIRA